MPVDVVPWLLSLVSAALFVWSSLRYRTEHRLRIRAENARDRAFDERDQAIADEARAARHTWGWFNAYTHLTQSRRRRQGCPRVTQEQQ